MNRWATTGRRPRPRGARRRARPPAGAQAKDTLTVALVSHAPTLDPHMHFERVGILVNINMFDSLLHRNTKLEFEPSLATSWKALNDTHVGVQDPQGRAASTTATTLTPEDVKYSFDRVLDQTKKSPQYGNIRAIKEVEGRRRRDVHIITDKPFPLLLERLVFFPHRAEEARREGRRSGLRHDGARRHGPVEVRGVEARPAHPARGLRPALARQAAVQAPRLPRHPRGRHAGRRDQDGRRRPHPRRLRRPHPRAQERIPQTYVSARRRSCACTTSSSTCGRRPSTRRRRGRRRTTRSTSRPSSRS